ncbi:ATP-binding protein [Streptomyces sp. NPDC055056]
MTAWVTRLREFYTHLGLTLGEFERLAGIDATTLSRYLSGRRLPEITFISKLDDAILARTHNRMGAEVRASVRELYLAACRTYEPQRYQVYMLADAVAAAQERAERAEEAVWELRGELQAEQQRRRELEVSLHRLEARVGTDHDVDVVRQAMAQVVVERDRLEAQWKHHSAELVTALQEQHVVVHAHDQLVGELRAAERLLDEHFEIQWGTTASGSADHRVPRIKAPRRRWGLRLNRSRRTALERLRMEAERAASELPTLASRFAAGDTTPLEMPSSATDVHADVEISRVADAMDNVVHAAVRLAVEQAMFANLSRRSQGLIRRQLTLISGLESRESDPERLNSLFQIDYLAGRMRRNGENLLALAGEQPAPVWRYPTPLTDVLRAAVSEVEQYTRVELGPSIPPTQISGRAVNDLVALLTELVENATSYSPPDTTVRVAGNALPDGRLLIEIHDAGIGLSAEDLAEINAQLASPLTVDLSVSPRMGLFVVGRLSQRQGIRIQLRPSDSGGTTALIMLPVGAIHDGSDAEETDEQKGSGYSSA